MGTSAEKNLKLNLYHFVFYCLGFLVHCLICLDTGQMLCLTEIKINIGLQRDQQTKWTLFVEVVKNWARLENSYIFFFTISFSMTAEFWFPALVFKPLISNYK